MKKNIPQNLAVTNFNKNKYAASTKTISGKKDGRYIYTEKDLGDGILDISSRPIRSSVAAFSAIYSS